MNVPQDPDADRVALAGADVLRIAETRVLLVVDEAPLWPPSEHPAWALCRGLGALGFADIQLCTSRDHAVDLSPLLPDGGVGWPSPLELHDICAAEAGDFEVVLHLGGMRRAKEECAALAAANGAGFASLSWGLTWVTLASGAVVPDQDKLEGPFGGLGLDPLPPVARIAAGLALQEALNSAGRLSSAAPPAAEVSFDAAAESRTGTSHARAWRGARIEQAIIDVVGAGGVGIHLLEALAPLLGDGCELRIFDFDEVGFENLAVQAAFAPEDVDRPKAVVMAERLAPACNPGLTLRPLVMRYEERPEKLARPSLRIACPDTFAARKYVNDCSLADGVPLVEAGSSPLAAQQRSYLPGRTACLEHRIARLGPLAAEERDSASCALEQALTLPGTNMICGGILAAEALRALEPARFGAPSRGTIVYDARFPERFGVTDLRPPCRHRSTRRS